MPEHSASCKYPNGQPCRQFSTDGTLMGAHIAHTMGTTDEDEIAKMPNILPFESFVDEEQRDWEETDGD